MKIALIRGVAQGAGTACRCMRGTVSPYHVALLKDTRLLVWLRLCGPCSTIFERRSRSRWHEPTRSAARGAETVCAPGNSNPKSSDTSLDLIPTLRSFGLSFTILEGHISPGPGACTTWPSCLRVLCTCLRIHVNFPAWIVVTSRLGVLSWTNFMSPAWRGRGRPGDIN